MTSLQSPLHPIPINQPLSLRKSKEFYESYLSAKSEESFTPITKLVNPCHSKAELKRQFEKINDRISLWNQTRNKSLIK
jgi:hypothetical protein